MLPLTTRVPLRDGVLSRLAVFSGGMAPEHAKYKAKDGELRSCARCQRPAAPTRASLATAASKRAVRVAFDTA